MEEENLFRILVATDCHLGFMEKDEIRRDDSFAAFEEICRVAEESKVDFILLGGDLFHENKPSRTTLVKTIEILRRYCLNDKPVQFQVVSDQTVNFPNVFGKVNYEDPNFNVGIPVFTIHGNHDDPAGVDNLSAIDILSSCNLVNYFGKSNLGGSGVGQASLHPILLQKGNSRIALYGLGNIRDERLNRMFQTPHAVQWVRPEPQEDCNPTDWFNIFVIHQNRIKSNPKNAVNEHFLARFLDLVIWGHEHECLVDPQEVPGMGFHVTQPGSSVATSLIDGEAKPKHILLVEIRGNQYRPTKIPLTSVRPFEYADVSLQGEPDLDPNDQSAVQNFLDHQVTRLIKSAAEKRKPPQQPMLPLIRIRVDYTGYTTLNPQRFGQKYVGKVANPHDILLFTKAAKKRAAAENLEVGAATGSMRSEELNQQNIEALVHESNLKMDILPVHNLAMALHEFVSKDDKQAFHACVKSSLEETQSKLLLDGNLANTQEEALLLQKLGQLMRTRESEAAVSAQMGISHISEPKEDKALPVAPDGVTSLKPARDRIPAPAASDLPVDEDEDFRQAGRSVSRLPPSSQGRSTTQSGVSNRGRGRGRGKSQVSSTPVGLKQSTLSLTPRGRTSKRAAATAAATALMQSMEGEDEEEENKDEIGTSDSEDKDVGEDIEDEAMAQDDSDEEPLSVARSSRGTKRAPKAQKSNQRGKPSKQAKGASGSSAAHKSFVDDDEDDDDNGKSNALSGIRNSATPSQSLRRTPQATRKWGTLRKQN